MNRRLIACMGAALLMSTMLSSAQANQYVFEQSALMVPNASSVLTSLTRINRESHYASTPGDYNIATWMRDELTRDGFTATLEPFKHDVPFVDEVWIKLVKGKQITGFALDETPIPTDPDGTRKDAGPPFNAWSGSGNAGALFVDAGHGLESDYQALRARGVDWRTRIVIVRYGREFRGNLALRAQHYGASGVIFFNDPADRNGSLRGPAYTDGPYRPLGSVERGALIEGQIKIPTIPVSANVAQQLLAHVHNGISDVAMLMHVKMKVVHNATMWNTVGVMLGKDPTHMVVVGAHRDAWVYGVTDNGSGISILLEAARAFGYLASSGWRPQFTIVMVGFDGEELGELGSQAYVAAHRAALDGGCIGYINQDESATGNIFSASSAASLENQFVPATQFVHDPFSARSLFAVWQVQPGGVTIAGPAGGSDFEPFLYDAGIPTVQYGFNGPFGVYHSGFDDLQFATKQADPGLNYHVELAQLTAILAFRLSNGTVPYTLAPYAARMNAALSAMGNRRDLSPVFAAVNRYASRAAYADGRSVDGNAEIAIVHRINKLFYGRSGYAPVAFPDLSNAFASGNQAAISAAAGRTAHELDDISAAIGAAVR